jgi:3,4-dihydroxy 2-butanone 4-phosphate synthase/GTP cyclohydrolase II
MADPLDVLFTTIPGISFDRMDPFITLSYAQSIDGSIAAQPDEQLMLSGADSMKMTHRLRAGHDALLVGVNTIIADNPQLTTRYNAGLHARPVVLDTNLRTPIGSNVLKHPKHPLLVCGENPPEHRAAVLHECDAEILPAVTQPDGRIDLGSLMSQLWSTGIKSVMVEGGASVISSILEEKLVDAFVLTIAPTFVGGYRAVDRQLIPPLEILEPHWFPLGRDLILWGELDRGGR